MVSSIQCLVSSDPRALAMILPVIMVLAAAQTGEAEGDNDTLTVEAQQANVNTVSCNQKRVILGWKNRRNIEVLLNSKLSSRTQTGEKDAKEITEDLCEELEDGVGLKCSCGPHGCGVRCGPVYKVEDFTKIFQDVMAFEDYTPECWGCKGSDVIITESEEGIRKYKCEDDGDGKKFECRDKVVTSGFDCCGLGESKDDPISHRERGSSVECKTKSQETNDKEMRIIVEKKKKSFNFLKENLDSSLTDPCESNAECTCPTHGCVVLAKFTVVGGGEGVEGKPTQECAGCANGQLEISENERDGTKIIKCNGTKEESFFRCRNKAITLGYDSCKLTEPIDRKYNTYLYIKRKKKILD